MIAAGVLIGAPIGIGVARHAAAAKALWAQTALGFGKTAMISGSAVSTGKVAIMSLGLTCGLVPVLLTVGELGTGIMLGHLRGRNK